MSVARSPTLERKGVLRSSSELDETWHYLREAYQELRRRRIELLRGLGLSWSEYAALQLCARAPAMPSDIADSVGVTSAGATDIIDRLEERRLVRRLSHPKDRRAVLVELTRSGERLYAETQSVLHRVAQELSKALTDRERDSLVTGLLAILRALRVRPA